MQDAQAFESPYRRSVALVALGMLILGIAFGGCQTAPEQPSVDELFTEGIVTEVQEVAPGEWKISDERVVPDSNASEVIARGLDGRTDTFGLAEWRSGETAVAATDSTSLARQERRSSISPLLLYGLFAYRMGGFSSGFRPNPGAYVNQSAYNRVQSGAGQRVSTAVNRRPVAAPRTGRTGYGARRMGGGRGFGG